LDACCCVRLPLMTGFRVALALAGAIALATPAARAPLTLARAFAIARRANPDLQEAAARADAADGVLARARAELYPTLAFNSNYQASDNPLRKFTFLLAQNVLNPVTLFNSAT